MGTKCIGIIARITTSRQNTLDPMNLIDNVVHILINIQPIFVEEDIRSVRTALPQIDGGEIPEGTDPPIYLWKIPIVTVSYVHGNYLDLQLLSLILNFICRSYLFAGIELNLTKINFGLNGRRFARDRGSTYSALEASMTWTLSVSMYLMCLFCIDFCEMVKLIAFKMSFYCSFFWFRSIALKGIIWGIYEQ